AKNMKPKSGGIFDPHIFGPDKQRWGYIELAAPMPNPIFADSISSLLGIQKQDIQKIVSGEMKLNGKTGGEAIRDGLAKVNVEQKLKHYKAMIDDPKVKSSELNNAVFAYKSLRALKEHGKTPSEAYTMKLLPVLPPIYRPFQESAEGTDRIDPLNQLYRRLGMVNSSLETSKKEG